MTYLYYTRVAPNRRTSGFCARADSPHVLLITRSLHCRSLGFVNNILRRHPIVHGNFLKVSLILNGTPVTLILVYFLFIRHKHNRFNLPAIEMKVESSTVINNAYDTHRKYFSLFIFIIANCKTELP